MRSNSVKRTLFSNYDVVLVMLCIFLGVFGLVMIYSTSSYNAARYYGDAKLYFNRQGLFLIIGFFAMIVVSQIDYRWYIKPWFGITWLRPILILYILCLGMQVYVLVNGYSAGGSSRWIMIRGIGTFQPSEVTKICFIVVVAYLAQKAPKRMNYLSGYLVVVAAMAPLLVLVARQNLSTAIIMAGILTVICFVVSRKKAYYAIVFMLLAGFAAVFVMMAGYRAERIENWLHPENLESGSQILSGLYAIASGGLWGKGLGESIEKLGYIPEVHTDMIFTVICEELGIFGGILVIATVLFMLWRLMLIAINAPDMYGGLIAAGVLSHIALQVLLNIAVVTNSVPATGIPFPFISYGGSSLLVLMAEMGIALSVSKYTVREVPNEEVEQVYQA
ncbi:MAG: putative lipid II flippase FtsW [Lachnospiraceae bacterium]|nr:putative lipid II flippase FtsW [Lachnospiraceae bacterium]